MELKRGQVVRSKAGRDQGGFLAVLEPGPGWVLVCDGKERPLERPKRKNRRHLAPTDMRVPEECLGSNRKLRAALGKTRRAT